MLESKVTVFIAKTYLTATPSKFKIPQNRAQKCLARACQKTQATHRDKARVFSPKVLG
jgi:hypothetical protein